MMITVYRKTDGAPLRCCDVPEGMADAQALESEAWIAGRATPSQFVDVATDPPTFVEREVIPPPSKTTIAADGGDEARWTGIPVGARVTLDGVLQGTVGGDGVFVFTADAAGRYLIEVDAGARYLLQLVVINAA